MSGNLKLQLTKMADSSNYPQPGQSTSPQTSKPIPLRGHHLTALAYAYKVGREKIAEMFMTPEYNHRSKRKERYTDDPNHPIIDVVMGLTKLIETPGIKFKIVNNAPDSVCSACEHPTKKRGECFGGKAALEVLKVRFGPYFAGKIESEDVRITRRHGLKIGRVYSSAKILEVIKDINARSLI